jgi:iron(III) transport system permease protein
MPIGVVVFWLLRGIEMGEELQPVWSAAAGSVYVSALAAAVCVLFSLPVAFLQVRYPSLYSSWLGRAAYLGYALPGIVIALSLVFFGANYVPLLYQTIAMLVFGYTVRFLPQSLGTLRTGLLQISPRLEEAARSLGHSKRWTFWRVTLPLLRPGIWAGAALVFLTTIKELPVTLLLAPTGFDTLAVSIWSETTDAFYARASAPALLLVAVSALSIFIVLRQEEREP